MSSTTKFARQVLTIAESLLTLSSLKHRISDSLVKAPAERDIEVCRGSDEQALDAEQLRLVLSENSNSRIPLRHLSKLLFRNNRTLTPIEYHLAHLEFASILSWSTGIAKCRVLYYSRSYTLRSSPKL